MSQNSTIEWTEATWNPVTGCTKVSPGCAHCYAETFAERWRGTPGHPYEQGFDLRLWPERLELPLKWRKPKRIFVNSMSDLFHESIPDDFIVQVFDMIRRCSNLRGHVFQILTKRPERMRDVCMRLRFDGSGAGRMWLADEHGERGGYAPMGGLPGCSPLWNVWLGVSIENRRFIGRADILRDTPAAVRFISAEPLLGPLIGPNTINTVRDGDVVPVRGWASDDGRSYWPSLDLDSIDWLIAGGESGPKHRRMDIEWVRDLRAACEGSGTAFFFKQWGGSRPKSNGRELDGRTWDEMPERAA